MATENTFRDFGRYLQAHRHARGLSLEDVATLTRITPANLLHIENEALDKLPADIFVKGFLRAYAEAVGADPKEAVRRYETRCHQQVLMDQSQAGHFGERFFYLRFLLALLMFALLIAVTLYVAHHGLMSGGKKAVPVESSLSVFAQNGYRMPFKI